MTSTSSPILSGVGVSGKTSTALPVESCTYTIGLVRTTDPRMDATCGRIGSRLSSEITDWAARTKRFAPRVCGFAAVRAEVGLYRVERRYPLPPEELRQVLP